jgi:long-chain acyl-CoA synthetase
VLERGDRPAFLAHDREGWREVGWAEAGRRVDEIAAGFLDLGVGKGDRAAISSRTLLEWTLCDLALLSIGAVVVPIYPTSSAPDTVHVLADSGARLLVCESAEQYAKLERARAELWALEHVVALEPFAGADLALTEVETRGRALLASLPQAVAEARANVAEDDVATCVYTSGTTGPPKGCLLTHGNWTSMADAIARVPGLLRPGDRVVLHLPLAHVFARIVELVAPRVGITIAFCPDSARLPAALRSVRPTVLPTVPRVLETVQRTVLARFAAARGPRRRLIEWALAIGREASRRRQAGAPYDRRLAAQLALADRLVFSQVKQRFGGNLRVVISGGAPLARDVAELFHALDVLVLEGYGLTESTAVATVNGPESYRLGTVGQAVPGVEIRIAGDGEILLRGANVFRGYHDNEEATRAVLGPDGWLRTGDVGFLDEDGFLTIVDRKKDIIVTPSGENVSPQNIENALRASRYVSQALVVGDRRPHLAALVAVDRDEVAEVARTEDELRDVIAEVVSGVNRRLGREEQVRRFAVLPRDFLPEEGEVTPTLKLRRKVCEEHFRDEIEALYATSRPGASGADDAG